MNLLFSMFSIKKTSRHDKKAVMSVIDFEAINGSID